MAKYAPKRMIYKVLRAVSPVAAPLQDPRCKVHWWNLAIQVQRVIAEAVDVMRSIRGESGQMLFSNLYSLTLKLPEQPAHTFYVVQNH